MRTNPSQGGTTLRQIYGYTAEGRLDTIGITSSAANVNFQTRKFGYNEALGTLDSLWFGNEMTWLRHLSDGSLWTIQLPSGSFFNQDVTESHGLTRSWTTAAVNSTVGRRVGRDSLGNVVHHSNDNGSNALKYVYDDLSRLREVKTSTAPNCYGDPELGWICEDGQTQVLESSDYDSVGNRFVDPTDDYATGNRLRKFDGCNYSNDLDGNITSRTCGSDVRLFTYYSDNKLKSATVNGSTANYYYDAAGRVVKIASGGPSGRYYWMGGNLLSKLNWNATSQHAEYSFYGGLDNLHAMRRNGTNYYAHRDGAGNVIALTDVNDNVKRTYEYDTWGVLTGGTDYASLAPYDYFRFKGAFSDPNHTGLSYMRNRWYEPESGRFMSEDPIGLAGGINPYSFAANNPISLRDPSGLRPCQDGETGAHSHGNSTNGKTGVTSERFHSCTKQQHTDEYDIGGFRFFDEDCIGLGANEETCLDEPDECVPIGVFVVMNGCAVGKILGWFFGTPQTPDEIAAGLMPTPMAGVLIGRAARVAAGRLGFTRWVPRQRAPFNSHGQAVFSNGKNYISPDVDGHAGGVWKMFSRRGRRMGTYDENLNRIGN